MTERFTYYPKTRVIKDNQTGERYYGNKRIYYLIQRLEKEAKQ